MQETGRACLCCCPPGCPEAPAPGQEPAQDSKVPCLRPHGGEAPPQGGQEEGPGEKPCQGWRGAVTWSLRVTETGRKSCCGLRLPAERPGERRDVSNSPV